MFALPLPADQIEDDDIIECFPVFFVMYNYFQFFKIFFWQDADTLGAWKAGQEAEWPRKPVYRFEIGARVNCRVGPDPVRGHELIFLRIYFISSILNNNFRLGSRASYRLALLRAKLASWVLRPVSDLAA